MVKEEVKRYLAEGLKRNYEMSTLKKNLLDAGFTSHDVEEAIWEHENAAEHKKEEQAKTAQKKSPEKKQPSVKLKVRHVGGKPGRWDNSINFFEKVAYSFIRPFKIFEKTKHERVYHPFMYHLKLMILPFLLVTAALATIAAPIIRDLTLALRESSPTFKVVTLFELGFYETTALLAVIAAILLFMVGPILLFFGVWITHLFAKLYKGKGTYADTFRAHVYSSTLLVLLIWLTFIPSLGWYLYAALGLWALIVFIGGLKHNHQFSTIRAILTVLTPVLVACLLTYLVMWLI